MARSGRPTKTKKVARTRRANNDGAVYESPKGSGIWWAQLPPDDQGQRPKRRAHSKTEAVQKLRELQKQRERGLTVAAKLPTVAELARIWLEEVVRRHRKESTYTGYAQILDLYILPKLGKLRVDKITTAQVQQLMNELHDKGLAVRTVRSAYARLSKLLDLAVVYQHVAYNAARSVTLPTQPAMPIRALEVTQAQAILAAVDGQRLAALYHTALLLGVRKGEVLGLRWADLDWEAGTVVVTQQVQSRRRTARSTIPQAETQQPGTMLDTPKTVGSARKLPLPPALLERLRTHRAQQENERVLRGEQWREHGLIFPSEVGTPMIPRNLSRHFDAVLRRAELPENVCVHDLRRTCATLLGDLGVSERIIGAILGHGDKNVTWRYARATIAMMRTGITQLETLLEGRAS